ncbi:gasdermin-E [Amia ocellicauda]|uniref:gasdermin-E n=1 Tax=Amia ocellicauda TaxID=2972642 RepID=UPI003463CA86
MFGKATSNFVKQIDPDGCLIPMSRLNDSYGMQPLALVVKRTRFWFWQKPKYISSDFTLSDVLSGDEPIKPEVVESDFLKYEGTFGDNLSGKLGTELGQLNLNVEGKGSSKLQSSFGNLKKREVDLQQLLLTSKGRFLNMEHSLVQQTREKKNEVFALVKESIFTTQQCSIIEQVQEQEQCAGILGFKSSNITISVNENGNYQLDSNVVLEIPPQTVLAYSVIELNVKPSGEYGLCLLPDTHGGFEAESSGGPPAGLLLSQVDGPRRDALARRTVPSKAPLTVLREDLEGFQPIFQPFAELPEAKQSELFEVLSKVVSDRLLISGVVDVLDQLCSGDGQAPANLDNLCPSQKRSATALLEAMGSGPEETDGTRGSSALLAATHLLVCALEGMSDAALVVLSGCFHPQMLQALQHLIRSFTVARTCPLSSAAAAPLRHKEFLQTVQRLFSSSSVVVQEEQAELRATTGQQPGFLPLLLCISVNGLAALRTGP